MWHVRSTAPLEHPEGTCWEPNHSGALCALPKGHDGQHEQITVTVRRWPPQQPVSSLSGVAVDRPA